MKHSTRQFVCIASLQFLLASGAHAALMSNAVLMFDGSVYGTGAEAGMVVGGTFFSFDQNGNGDIELFERAGMNPYQGVRLGTAQPASGSHSGPPDGSESPSIDAPWNFFSNTGMHYSNTPVTVVSASGNTAYLDMSGWGMTWAGVPEITLGSGSWGSNPEGQAVITCEVDCSVGDRFSMYYTATIPVGDPSGIGGVRYRLGLEGATPASQSQAFAQAVFNDSDPGMAFTGTILAPVPLPMSVWLLGSGLLGLFGATRRRKI